MIRSIHVVPGSAADRSVTGFRLRHNNMSRATYYRMKKESRGPRETVCSPQTIIITEEDEAAYDRATRDPNATVRRLRAKMEKNRVAKAKKAAAAAVASERHMSKRRRKIVTVGEALPSKPPESYTVPITVTTKPPESYTVRVPVKHTTLEIRPVAYPVKRTEKARKPAAADAVKSERHASKRSGR